MRIRAATGSSCACALVLTLVLQSGASAQLVVGSTTASAANPAATYIDITSSIQTTLWNPTSTTNVNGLSADNAGGKLYMNDAARLAVWNFGSVGTQPTQIA